MRCALAPLAVVVALVLAGCGPGGGSTKDSSKDFTGDQAKVATVVEDLQAAAKKRDGGKICSSLLTPELGATIAKKGASESCPTEVKDVIKDTDDVDLIVKTVKLDGSSATATVQEKLSGSASRTVTVGLERSKASGRWQISELPAPAG